MPLIRPSLRPVAAALAVAGVLGGAVVAANAATRTDTDVVAPAETTQPAPPSSSSVADPPVTGVLTPATVVTPSTASTATPRPASTPKAKAAKEPASGQQAVAAFTAAIDRGDAAAAWRLLAPRSQAYWGTQARFAATMDKLAQGGYGGWTGDRSRTARTAVISSSGEGEILIVTLSGTTSRQGQMVPRAHAFPVRHLKGSFRLELWDLGGGDTVPQLTAPGPVLEATVRTTDRTPAFQATAHGDELAWALDDRDARFTRVNGGVARYQTEQALSPGTHVLTVASVGPGWLTASAVIVVVG